MIVIDLKKNKIIKLNAGGKMQHVLTHVQHVRKQYILW